MSDHNIGRGLNAVVKTVIELYDARALDMDSAKKIIASCGEAVNWSDGNTYEATDYIRRCQCGKCLKMIPEGEKLYSVWDVSNEVPDSYHIEEKAGLATDGLCAECFDEVISQQCHDPKAGKREMKYIESNVDEDQYRSEGKYPNTNNGYRWPRLKKG